MGKWANLGPKMVHPHKSESTLNFDLNFAQ